MATRWFALALVAVSWRYSDACTCAALEHPQTHYCNSDFVIVGRVQKTFRGPSFYDAYKVKIRNVFKASPKAEVALKSGRLLTPSEGSLCGVTLQPRETYVITGRVIQLQAHVHLCGYIKKWREVTPRQRKGFRLLYKRGCTCKVHVTKRKTKSPNTCVTNFDDCYDRHGICLHDRNSRCRWTRAGRETYGDDAIGYVQVKRVGDICTVKCRITPEHKVRAKPYFCALECDEKEQKILVITCEGCAASQGGCKHAVAFLMWLHRRTEEPSPTEVKCYWKKSNLSGIGTTKKFIKTKDFRGNKEDIICEDCGNDFLEKIVQKMNDLHIDCQLYPYYKEKSDLQKMSMHYLVCFFTQNFNDLSFEVFLNYCTTEMKEEKCQLVEKSTRTQSNSDIWYEIRYGRVTASKAHEAAQCHTHDGTLVEDIFGAKLVVETEAMKRGKLLEHSVKKEVEKQRKISIQPSGLFLSAEYPFFGASPDGITDTHVIEIKCPSKKASMTQYYKDGAIGKKYLAQIQAQMLLTKKAKGLFCIAHCDFEASKKVDIIEVEFDSEYCQELLEKIKKFWEQCIFKKLIKIGQTE